MIKVAPGCGGQPGARSDAGMSENLRAGESKRRVVVLLLFRLLEAG